MIFHGKKVLGIVAHPDYEFIYGWPVMQDRLVDRYLIISMDDHTKYSDKKRDAACIACDGAGIKIIDHLHSDGRYFRMIRKSKPFSPIERINNLISSIEKAIVSVKPDYLFTHNPWGEGGNCAHQLISNIVINTFVDYSVLITDICHLSRSWFSFREIPRMWKGICTKDNKVGQVTIDKSFYDKGREAYDKFGMWTREGRGRRSRYPAGGNCGVFII